MLDNTVDIEPTDVGILVNDEDPYEFRPIFDDIPAMQPRSNTVVLSDDEEIFFENGCGCEWNCHAKFTQEEIMSSRWNCLEMSYNCDQHVNHLNIALRGALNALVRTSESTMKKQHQPKDRKQTYTEYSFRGRTVCRKFFQFAFDKCEFG